MDYFSDIYVYPLLFHVIKATKRMEKHSRILSVVISLPEFRHIKYVAFYQQFSHTHIHNEIPFCFTVHDNLLIHTYLHIYISRKHMWLVEIIMKVWCKILHTHTHIWCCTFFREATLNP